MFFYLKLENPNEDKEKKKKKRRATISSLKQSENCREGLCSFRGTMRAFLVHQISKGEGPGSDPKKWRELFKAAQIQ